MAVSIKSKIGRCIPFKLKLSIRFLQRCFLIFFRRENLTIYDGGGSFNNVLNDVAEKILLEDPYVDKSIILKDIVWCYICYGFTPLDYFLFNFHKENNTKNSRNEFVSDVYKDYKLFWKEGVDSYAELYDKYRFYERTKEYFKRAVMFVNVDTKESDFVNFVLNVKDLFIKSNSDSYGRGAFAIVVNKEEGAKVLFKKLKNNSFIVEERLKQSKLMGKWNSSSINTIRVNSYLTDKGFYVLAPFIRTGRKGSVVDNGGAGGVFATIDERSGIIITDGYDEKGNSYKNHPDSNIKYKDAQIPEWNSLLNLAEEIHRKCMSNHIYISWDFAYTDSGWTLIEGNWGQFICQQTSTKRGFKTLFDKYMNGKAISL